VPNLKEVRIRIESVKSTQQITSAMKLVAASKLKKAQNAIITLRPYVQKMQEIMENLSESLEGSDQASYSQVRPIRRVLIIVLTSNRGLCGPFNSNVIKTAKQHISEHYSQLHAEGRVDLYCIGKKGGDFFRKNKYNVIKSNIEIFDKLKYDEVVKIAEELMGLYADKTYDHIEIIYNRFKNAAVQIMTTEPYLPIVPKASGASASKTDYIFEPGKEQILGELIPKTLKIQLYKAILDSFAAEHGARMTAMHLATDNAGELLKDLKLSYNKARQAAITKELLEIVTGAEALKG